MYTKKHLSCPDFPKVHLFVMKLKNYLRDICNPLFCFIRHENTSQLKKHLEHLDSTTTTTTTIFTYIFERIYIHLFWHLHYLFPWYIFSILNSSRSICIVNMSFERRRNPDPNNASILKNTFYLFSNNILNHHTGFFICIHIVAWDIYCMKYGMYIIWRKHVG